MAKAPKPGLDDTTIQIARQMLSTPPKPHEEMKLGKRKHHAQKRKRPKK